ncbi:MAG: 4Fe-4S dicluster domain-containing protein [Proteobacteria bacterium]|nr:4Fe-4S dicluster domain-containing protein [Pseudomonadota bacterium]MBU1386671.1 4Fe-4S dicluster domain-containing protein [Pseudomonadota bacterium]MBU1543282.1 4Fe-4S dicluster domain-containing protein [Pseudomonadota bacterium]MBU2429688.1 4Fe-4S dicluster domain-containing protein [Pseudomonadota bacterium]MBU2483113.1 4Fe-4S dicluster domain-containing protein [Pseudomonadota bacterium]
MEKIEISNRFKLTYGRMPDASLIQLPAHKTVAVSAMDIPYIRPKLLVKENDPVKTGTPLFFDKRNSAIQYVSPGTGKVQKIVFGERRRLKEVVIALDNRDDFVRFEAFDSDQFETFPKADIIQRLQKGGLWQCFREFPSRDTADDTHTPPMIIVSLNGNDPYSPEPGIALGKNAALFESGLKLLKCFTPKIIISARSDSLATLGKLKQHVTHVVSDTYPSWDPGVVLYKLKTSVAENQSWCISAEHLIWAVQLLLTGQYPVTKVVTVTRNQDKKPHMLIRQGAPVKDIIGQIKANTLITTGQFNGRQVDPDSHIGFFETHLNVIPDIPNENMFSFIRPGFSTPSASKTFISSLIRTPKKFDCNLHGEERACINCGYCTRICPVDLAPSFVMKALASDDIEDALGYGLWDCVRCGLCSFVCPSKIELTQILSKGMDAYYKDKQ